MFSAKFTELSENDILSTLLYISEKLSNPKAAENLYYEIDRKTTLIEENPFLFPSVPDPYLAKKGLRWIGVKNYMMFYVVKEEEEKISIIRFLYGRRDWKNILNENNEI